VPLWARAAERCGTSERGPGRAGAPLGRKRHEETRRSFAIP
jgi:hypothetical protein